MLLFVAPSWVMGYQIVAKNVKRSDNSLILIGSMAVQKHIRNVNQKER
jgi:hypothetical protein